MNDGYEDVRTAFDDHAEQVFPVDYTPRDPGPDPRTPCDGVPMDPDIDPAEALAEECAGLPLNDTGNGKRFTAYFGGDVLFIPRVGWFVWDGRCWTQDDDQLEVRRLLRKVSKKVTKEADFIRLEDWEIEQIEDGKEARNAAAIIKRTPAAKRSDDQRASLDDCNDRIDRAAGLKTKLASMRKSHHNHAKAAGNTGPINNMMGEAKVDLYKDLSETNANKIMFNTENCVLSFRELPKNPVTGKRVFELVKQDHARELLLTKMMNVKYDPDAKSPIFDAFLKSILPSKELRDFVQRWFGYSITGLTTEQKLVFMYGAGRNGKSTLVDLIADLMGAYAATVPIESLAGSEQRKGGDATPDLVRLPGARMVRASEPERGQKMREALIKQLTGGEAILVRRMMQEFVEVKPEFSLTIQGNYKPEIRGTDNGIWRRVLLVPFLTVISEEDTDPLLPAKLEVERSGVLNWLLEGCKSWLEDGLMIPQIVSDATQDYREESDPMLEFIQGCCEVTGDKDHFTRAKVMNEAFKWWQEDCGSSDAWGTRTIFKHLKDKTDFFKSESGKVFWHDKHGHTGWRGIALTAEFLQRREDQASGDQYAAA